MNKYQRIANSVARQKIAGANDFREYGKGTNAKKIFEDLQDDARRQYGDDPYSGTIATKDGFKIVSKPLTRTEAQDLADDMIDRNDKWGPAFAIPVVEQGKGKKVKVKKKVGAKNENEARDAVIQMMKEKYGAKGLDVQIDYRSIRVSLLKKSALSIKPVGKSKPVVKYQVTSRRVISPTFDSVKDAKDWVKNPDFMDRLQDGDKFEIVAVFENSLLEEYEVTSRTKGGNQYLVEGEIEVAKPSTKVEGYMFFGIAPS